METNPINLRYWKPEISLSLILSSGFLDLKFSAFPSSHCEEKRGIDQVAVREGTHGENRA